MDDQKFPILGEKFSIPWGLIEHHGGQAKRNHYQTLQRLKERGGLSWCEALAVIEDRPYATVPDAKAKLLRILEQWNATRADKVHAAAVALRKSFSTGELPAWENDTLADVYTAAAEAALKAAADV